MYVYIPAAQTVQFSFGQISVDTVDEVPCTDHPLAGIVLVPIVIDINPPGFLLTDIVVTISVTGNATCRSSIIALFAAHCMFWAVAYIGVFIHLQRVRILPCQKLQ